MQYKMKMKKTEQETGQVEEPKQKTIKDLSVTELKALAFDKQMLAKQYEQEYSLIIQELQQRLQK